MKLSLPLLASAALVLISAVPGFAKKSPAAVAKPIENFNAVVDALIDEPTDLFGVEEFDAEEEEVSTKLGKSGKSHRRHFSSRRRKRSDRRRRKRSNRRYRNYVNHRHVRQWRNFCRDYSSDRECRRAKKDFCDSRKNRRKNRNICRYAGFKTVAEGSAEDAPETYADDSEIFSEETLDDIDVIMGNIRDELDSEDFSEDFDSEDFSEDEWSIVAIIACAFMASLEE